MILKIGNFAPSFNLEGSDGKIHKLDDYKSKKLILYFYPKDDTPGCTIQACKFRDGYDKLKKSGFVVLGVSGDNISSHKKFIEKHKLNFTLLSDPDKKVINLYGAFKEKSMFGKSFLGIRRSTYVIENGVITKIILDSSPEDCVNEILR